MTDIWLKHDYDAALDSVFGVLVGSEISRQEAERMFFPFVYNNKLLEDENGNVAYILKNDNEFVTHVWYDSDEDDDFFDQQELWFETAEVCQQIGEVTEVGIRLLRGNDCTVTFQAEPSSTTGALAEGGFSLTVTDEDPHQKSNIIKLFGRRIYFELSTNSTGVKAIVYTKYKVHSLGFDFTIEQGDINGHSMQYWQPLIAGGYKIVSGIYTPLKSGSYKFNIQKTSGSLSSFYTFFESDASVYKNNYSHYFFTPTPNGNLSTSYRDYYMGPDSGVNYPYRLQLQLAHL